MNSKEISPRAFSSRRWLLALRMKRGVVVWWYHRAVKHCNMGASAQRPRRDEAEPKTYAEPFSLSFAPDATPLALVLEFNSLPQAFPLLRVEGLLFLPARQSFMCRLSSTLRNEASQTGQETMRLAGGCEGGSEGRVSAKVREEGAERADARSAGSESFSRLTFLPLPLALEVTAAAVEEGPASMISMSELSSSALAFLLPLPAEALALVV